MFSISICLVDTKRYYGTTSALYEPGGRVRESEDVQVYNPGIRDPDATNQSTFRAGYRVSIEDKP